MLRTFQSNTDGIMTHGNSNFELAGARLMEMKSIQPYSTKDEYLYAMKEDLAEWFNSMYSTKISADNFAEQLENGVIICYHANNVMRAAVKVRTFNPIDLANAGMSNGASQSKPSAAGAAPGTPSGKALHALSGEYVMYKQDARPQSFHSRDNISNFIKWCRCVVKVRECLMFETDDLILRKNENNFILCLLEIARFGSKFGIEVPTIIKFELEIEAELEREKQAKRDELLLEQQQKQDMSTESEQTAAAKLDELIVPVIDNKVATTTFPLEQSDKERLLDEEEMPSMLVIKQQEGSSRLPHNSNSSLDSTGSLSNEDSVLNTPSDEDNIDKKFDNLVQNFALTDSLENLNKDLMRASQLLTNMSTITTDTNMIGSNIGILPMSLTREINSDQLPIPEVSVINTTSTSSVSNSPMMPSPISSSPSSSNSFSALHDEHKVSPNSPVAPASNSVRNLAQMLENAETNKKMEFSVSGLYASPRNILNKKRNSAAMTNNVVNNNNNIDLRSRSSSMERLVDACQQNETIYKSQNNLHRHVCSIADKCTCEKKFSVVKLGEGKYRIGNTKNIVFIRILRNHIMVRVGGGWDTLENYLNKHDPCRSYNDHHCSGIRRTSIGCDSVDKSSTSLNSKNNSCNILLTPVSSNTFTTSIQPSRVAHTPIISATTNPAIQATVVAPVNTVHYHQPSVASASSSIPIPTNTSGSSFPLKKDAYANLDFTDAKLVIERNTDGKHIVNKILLVSPPHSSTTTPATIEDFQAKSVGNQSNNINKGIYASANSLNNNNDHEMHNFLKNSNFVTPIKQNSHHHNHNNNATTPPMHHNVALFKNNNLNLSTNLPASNSLNSINSYLIAANSIQKGGACSPGGVYEHFNHPLAMSSSSSKTESLLRSKMKKLINRFPTPSSQNNNQDKVYNNTNQETPQRQQQQQEQNTQQQPGLLKFNRTATTSNSGSYSGQTTASNFSNQHCNIYTDTKLPPRILRKYEKQRAMTEAIVNNEADIRETILPVEFDEKVTNRNDDDLFDGGGSSEVEKFGFKATTSSPKAPPRIKKKYRRSKTADLSKHQKEFMKGGEDLDSLDDEDDIKPSVVIDKKTKSEESQSDEVKYRDSLESLNRIEKDSLCDTRELEMMTGSKPRNSLSISETSSTKRAQWDKSRLEIEFKTETAVAKNKTTVATTVPHSMTFDSLSSKANANQVSNAVPINSSLSSTTSSNSSNAKKARQLNAAKEKLYEMKKSIDAKLATTNSLAIPKSAETLTPMMANNLNTGGIRTTPRKVKKRSEERSITSAIVNTDDLKLEAREDSRIRSNMATPRTMTPTRLNGRVSLADKMTLSSANKRVSASLHNLTNLNDTLTSNNGNSYWTTTTPGRHRRDSYASTVSSTGTNHLNQTISGNFVEYKENKAFELRKKSALMNKIVGKSGSQLINDPIYTRSHPISTQMTEQQHALASLMIANNPMIYHKGGSVSGTATPVTSAAYDNTTAANTARKRLFAKKNERFDPNNSFQSNISSASSSTASIPRKPTTTNIPRDSPRTHQYREAKKPASQLQQGQASKTRSKSSNQIIQAENAISHMSSAAATSSSTQNLLNLMVYDTSRSDSEDKCRIMLNECQRVVENNIKSMTNFKKLKEVNNKETDFSQDMLTVIHSNNEYSTSSSFSLSPSSGGGGGVAIENTNKSSRYHADYSIEPNNSSNSPNSLSQSDSNDSPSPIPQLPPLSIDHLDDSLLSSRLEMKLNVEESVLSSRRGRESTGGGSDNILASIPFGYRLENVTFKSVH